MTVKTGQTHVHRSLQPLLERVQKGEIDPSFVITHRLSLDEAPHGYKIFHDKHDDCMKVVLKPSPAGPALAVEVASEHQDAPGMGAKRNPRHRGPVAASR